MYDLGVFYYLLINSSFCFYMIFVLYREGSFYIDNSANRILALFLVVEIGDGRDVTIDDDKTGLGSRVYRA